MKAIGIFIGLLFSTLSIAAVPNAGTLLKTEFSVKTREKVSSSRSEIVLSSKNRDWVTIAQHKDGLMLLGRPVEITDQGIHIEFLVLDTRKKPNHILSNPSMIGRFGQATEINDFGNQQISIRLTPKKTNYSVISR